MTKGMVSVVEYVRKTRDRKALTDKAVDRTMEIAGKFSGKNVMDLLATYRNEMQQILNKFLALSVWWNQGFARAS